MADGREAIKRLRDGLPEGSAARLNCDLVLESFDEPGYLARLLPRLRRTAASPAVDEQLRDAALALLEILGGRGLEGDMK